jgi:hypothetical protein
LRFLFNSNDNNYRYLVCKMYDWSESDDNPIINEELDSVLCYPQLMTKRELFKLIKEVFHILIIY